MDGIRNGQGESLAHRERGIDMYFVSNDFYGGGCHFDTLKEAVYHARRLQRLAYRAGVVSHTRIHATNGKYYKVQMPVECDKLPITHKAIISVRLYNVLARSNYRTVSAQVHLGAAINGGFVNPWKIRNLGKRTLAELHSVNHEYIQTVTAHQSADHLALF